jgi:hypothetical protein
VYVTVPEVVPVLIQVSVNVLSNPPVEVILTLPPLVLVEELAPPKREISFEDVTAHSYVDGSVTVEEIVTEVVPPLQ